MPATDGQLPTDTIGYRASGVYVPGVGTVAQLGGPVSVDVTGQPYAPTIGYILSNYPLGATIITSASGNVAAAVATATLAAVAGKTTYITAFTVTGTGATAALAVNVTVTGVTGGTLTYTYAAAVGATVENTILKETFVFPLPASAPNTAIVVSCPSLGTGNTNNCVVVYGFQV